MQSRSSLRQLRSRGLFAVVILATAACQASASPDPPNESAVPSAAPSAEASESADLNLVTIGDSIPYAGADCGGCASFTALFAESIEADTGLTVSAENLSSHEGLTAEGLANRIQTSEPMRTAVAGADIVVVTIGHNSTPWNLTDDPCDGAAEGPGAEWALYTGECVIQVALAYGEHLDAILTEIEAMRGDRPTAIRVTTDYNDIIGLPEALPEWTDPSAEVIDAFHAETCRVAEARGVVCVDVYHSFNGPNGRTPAGALLASDYTHPSSSGQQRIADLLIQAGLEPLAL
jgi:lysophospholipase L1-like esterase